MKYIFGLLLLLAGCKMEPEEQWLLVASCTSGVNVYQSDKTNTRRFASTFASGEVAPNVETRDICNPS